MYRLLEEIYNNADRECSIEISFDRNTDGSQSNVCRSLLLDYARAPSVASALPLATRLSLCTTKRSALGLLFLVLGLVKGKTRVIVARFAANSGILADEKRDSLQVHFVEHIFLKSIKAYKAVLYEDSLNLQAF